MQKLGLVRAGGRSGKPGGMLELLGYIVHGDRSDLANSNVADVFYSITNMLGTATTIIVILLSRVIGQDLERKPWPCGLRAVDALCLCVLYCSSPQMLMA